MFDEIQVVADNLYDSTFKSLQYQFEHGYSDPKLKNTQNILVNVTFVKDFLPYFKELIQQIKQIPF